MMTNTNVLRCPCEWFSLSLQTLHFLSCFSFYFGYLKDREMTDGNNGERNKRKSTRVNYSEISLKQNFFRLRMPLLSSYASDLRKFCGDALEHLILEMRGCIRLKKRKVKARLHLKNWWWEIHDEKSWSKADQAGYIKNKPLPFVTKEWTS